MQQVEQRTMMPPRLARLNPILGATTWLLALLLSLLGQRPLPDLHLLLLFAVLVISPLALAVLAPDAGSRLFRLILVAYVPAALPAAFSFVFDPGPLAALLVLPWLLFTALLALEGLTRLMPRPPHVEAWAISAGLIYVAVGGFWLLLSRGGIAFLDFREPIVTLTAIHFHYISLAALIVAGLIGRALRPLHPLAYRLYRAAALGLIVAPPLVAAGITFSLVLESLAALLLAISLSLIALLALWRLVPALGRSPRGLLLALSSLSVLLTMAFALAYAIGRLTGAWTLTIPTMIAVHGWLNALGFSLCGLLAFALQMPGPQPTN